MSLPVGLHYNIANDRLFTAKELDQFIELYENPQTNEHVLHRFLKEHPKFLFALGAYEALLSEVELPSEADGGSSARNGMRLRLDFLLRDYQGAWDVVELKKPTKRTLVVGPQNRRRFGVELQDSIAQVKTYLDRLHDPSVLSFFTNHGIMIAQPVVWLLIGRDDDLLVSERRRLENDLPHALQIRTYDHLLSLARARQIVMTMPSIVIPTIDRNQTIDDVISEFVKTASERRRHDFQRVADLERRSYALGRPLSSGEMMCFDEDFSKGPLT